MECIYEFSRKGDTVDAQELAVIVKVNDKEVARIPFGEGQLATVKVNLTYPTGHRSYRLPPEADRHSEAKGETSEDITYVFRHSP
jgi:hypothetical protein